LTDFSVANYGDEYTLPASDTSSATIGGTTGPISSFGNSIQQAIMVTDPGDAEMAVPSSLVDTDKDGDSNFSVTWQNPGP
jgi:hypothetical protein